MSNYRRLGSDKIDAKRVRVTIDDGTSNDIPLSMELNEIIEYLMGQIKDLEERVRDLEFENSILRED